MATSANPPPGAHPIDNGRQTPDPFLMSGPSDLQRQRFAGSDSQYASLYANGSSSQAKRALEAHLAETERRLQEASRLGTILVKQRQDLSERLKEVADYSAEDEVNPELRQKLVELEREVNEVTRESARAFLSKSRVVSNDTTDSSVLSSDAHSSPSKIHPPSSRKQRNQAPSRVNDIKLATDISHTLLNQVRELQAAFAEKDEALKSTTLDKSQLEADLDSLRLRLRSLDENEQRYKDENWWLETQVHELTAARKDLSERELKLQQQLSLSKTQGASVLREFEEIKQAHGKLSEDHGAARKHHDVEVAALKKDVTSTETERDELQRRVEELMEQNKELAKAMSYRSTSGEHQVLPDFESDVAEDLDGRVTPEHSPPGSPSKATPRHGALESETLKSSLHHAHRMIQNLKNNIHREKTEKIELKRLLQEARDDIETRRSFGGVDSGKKRKSAQQDVFKKPTRPSALGAARADREDIIMDDPDWEEHDGSESPSRRAVGSQNLGIGGRNAALERPESANMNYPSDTNYVTATEQSDAFETANERELTTENEAFQTGAEDIAGDSSGDATETESAIKRRPVTIIRPAAQNRRSFLSTASTSDDEALHNNEMKTPVQQQSRFKARLSRGPTRSAAQSNTESPAVQEIDMQDSPASLASSAGTPSGGQSLFAELGNLSDAETEESSTPRSSNVLSPPQSPEKLKKSPAPSQLRNTQLASERLAMVDSSVMTEPWEPESRGILSTGPAAIGAALAGGLGFMLGTNNTTKSAESKNDVPQVLQNFDSHNDLSDSGYRSIGEPEQATEYANFAATAQEPRRSPKLSRSIEPVETKPLTPSVPKFQASPILSASIEPVEAPLKAPSQLSRSSIEGVPIAPLTSPPAKVSEPAARAPAPVFGFSSLLHVESQPQEPERPATASRVLPAGLSAAAAGVLAKDGFDHHTATSSVPVEDGAARAEAEATTVKPGFLGSLFQRKRDSAAAAAPVIAEDETARTAQDELPEPKTLILPEDARTRETRMPFQPVDANAVPNASAGLKFHPPIKARLFATGGTQTMLSAEDLDRIIKDKAAATAPLIAENFAASPILPNRAAGSVSPKKSKDAPGEHKPRRPASSGSLRGRNAGAQPPLPSEARQTIAAASHSQRNRSNTGGAPSTPGKMGPPIMPASAYRNRDSTRPQTPVGNSTTVTGGKVASNPRSLNRSVANSPATTRRSSVSSFASELEQRFNIHRGQGNVFGAGTNIDPRMIQAITHTMMGEYLWKYTRKAGRQDMSGTRHRRFFWIHPYTKTLYWSEQNPATAGRAQLKAKSVAIQSVHAINDENPNPPGLHRKSIVVTTPGRTIQFTANTSQRHETWFNALSYLLLPTRGDEDEATDETAGEVADEANPTMRSSSRLTTRSRMSNASHRSYGGSTVGPSSNQQANGISRRQSVTSQAGRSIRDGQQPRLEHQTSRSGRFSSLSGVFRSSSAMTGSYSARGSRTVTPDLGGNTEAHNSAEELRQTIEAQERDADRLENVRACCDGKHDVGHIPHQPVRSSSRINRHSLTSRSYSNAGSYVASASTTRQHQEMDPANYVE